MLGLPASASYVALLQALDFNPASGNFVGKLLRNGGTSTMDCRIVNPTNFTGTMLLVNGGGPIEQPMTAGASPSPGPSPGPNLDPNSNSWP